MWPNVRVQDHSAEIGWRIYKNFHRGVLTHVEARNSLMVECGLDMATIIRRIGPAIESVETHLL